MSIDPGVLKRLVEFRISIEGNNSWAFREFIDLVLDILEERLSLILNEAVEPYGLEASVLNVDGCKFFSRVENCKDVVTVGIYEKESDTPLVYVGYLVSRGENILEVKPIKIVDAETLEEI